MAASDSILTPWWAVVGSYLSIHGSVGVCVFSLHHGDSAAVATLWMVLYEPVWTCSYMARSEFGGSHSLYVVHADGTLSTPPGRVRIPVSSDSSIPFAFCSPRGSEVPSHRGFGFCFLTD